MDIFAFFFLLFLLAYAAFCLKSNMDDRKRIQEFVRSFGGEFICIKDREWGLPLFLADETFEPRRYRVHYRDKSGCLREAVIKTSWMHGTELLRETNLDHRRREKEIRQRSEDVTRRLQERIDQSRATAKFDADKRG